MFKKDFLFTDTVEPCVVFSSHENRKKCFCEGRNAKKKNKNLRDPTTCNVNKWKDTTKMYVIHRL